MAGSKKDAKGLTSKQAEFCRYRVLEGKTILESMRLAGFEGSDDNLKKYGYKVNKLPHVRDEITRLIDEAKYTNMANKEVIKKFFMDGMTDESLPLSERRKFGEVMAKLEGMFTETQVVTEAESHYRQSTEGWVLRKKMLLENDPEKALRLGVVTQKEYNDYLDGLKKNKDGTTDV